MSIDEAGSETSFPGTLPRTAERKGAKRNKTAGLPLPVDLARVWHFDTVNGRALAAFLTGLSAKNVTVFAVMPNGGVGGSFDVLSYTESEQGSKQ